MCLYTTRQRCRDFVKKNKGKTWLYVYKIVRVANIYGSYNYTTIIGRVLESPFQGYKNKVGLNYACEKYIPKFNRHTEVGKGFHFYLTKESAKKDCHSNRKIIKCKVFMKDFIAAGVWDNFEVSNKEKENYQAVFGSYYVSEHQYNKALK